MKTSLFILMALCLTLLPGCIKEIKEVRLDGQRPDVRELEGQTGQMDQEVGEVG